MEALRKLILASYARKKNIYSCVAKLSIVKTTANLRHFSFFYLFLPLSVLAVIPINAPEGDEI